MNAGAPAATAAAGDPLEERLDLATLVARLPWPTDSLGLAEARQVVEAMAYAEQQFGWDHERLQTEGVNALTHRKGDPVRFVAKRFHEGYRLGRFQLAPRSERLSNELASTEPQSGDAGNQEEQQSGASMPEWCRQCGDGDPRAEFYLPLRRVEDGNGDMVPCRCTHPGWQHNAA